MKITVNYISPFAFKTINTYKFKTILNWIYWFRKYEYVSGFMIRLFGIHVDVREKNATEKLIKLARENSIKRLTI